jgi:RNA polymerase sigma-70 factor (ECF subfamily)
LTSDWESLDRARCGDDGGWRDLVERHHARLVSVVLLITGSPDAAKDIAQEAFTRLFSVELAHRSGTVGGWLSTTAYHLAVKECQRAHRQEQIEGVDPPDAAPSPLDGMLIEERDRHLAAAIRALDPLHREILVLRFYGGQSYEDIARLLNVPLGTVKSRIFYAVKSCQQTLRDRGLLE